MSVTIQTNYPDTQHHVDRAAALHIGFSGSFMFEWPHATVKAFERARMRTAEY